MDSIGDLKFIKKINKKVDAAIYSKGCYGNYRIDLYVNDFCSEIINDYRCNVITTGIDECSLYINSVANLRFPEFGIKYDIVRINNGLIIKKTTVLNKMDNYMSLFVSQCRFIALCDMLSKDRCLDYEE